MRLHQGVKIAGCTFFPVEKEKPLFGVALSVYSAFFRNPIFS
jgi:hypothetical protein